MPSSLCLSREVFVLRKGAMGKSGVGLTGLSDFKPPVSRVLACALGCRCAL